MATKNTITEREIYTSMINGTIDPDVMVEFATKKLAQLDKRNASAKARAAKKRAEGDALTEAVFALVTEEPQSRQDIFDALVESDEFAEVKLGSVGFRLTTLVKEGRIAKAEASVEGPDGKAHRVMVYSLA